MTRTVHMIFARDSAGGFGMNDGRLPWPRCQWDMSHFRETTLNSSLIMGRRTYESLGGLPLPRRTLAVLTRDAGSYIEDEVHGVWAAKDWADAMRLLGDRSGQVFCIGGTGLFDDLVQGRVKDQARLGKVYLTEFHRSWPADIYYGEKFSDFIETDRREHPDGVLRILERRTGR